MDVDWPSREPPAAPDTVDSALLLSHHMPLRSACRISTEAERATDQ
jgi:hypothetical protein